MAHWDVITEASELGRYQEAWNALLARSTEATPFDTYQWKTAWLDCFWPGKPIQFLFRHDKGSLTGVVPLLDDRCGDLWCKQTLVSPDNDYSDMSNILCEGEPTALLDALLEYLRSQFPASRFAFTQSMLTAPLAKFLPRIAGDHRMITIPFETPGSPVIRLEGDWDSYLRSRSRHFAKEMRRKVKNFDQAGHVDRVIVTEERQCDQAMEDILRIERNSWKEETGTSFSAGAGLEQLYREFARQAAAMGWLRLYLLYLDSKPVAHIYGVVFRNRYYAFKTSYDTSYRSLSPGAVVFDQALRDAFDLKLETFDLLGVNSRWKSELTDEVRQRINICVADANLAKCSACRFFHCTMKPFVKKRMPFLVTMRRRLREMFASPAVRRSRKRDHRRSAALRSRRNQLRAMSIHARSPLWLYAQGS